MLNNNQLNQTPNSTSPVNGGYTEILALVCEQGSKPNTVLCEKGVQGVCGSCGDRKDGCVPDVMAGRPAEPERFEVINRFNAAKGDVVRIAIAERSVWLSVIISYLIPLLGLLVGSSGAAIISFWFSNEILDWVAIIGAFVGLLLGIVLACCLARYLVNEIWAPKMLGVLGGIKPCSDKESTKY